MSFFSRRWMPFLAMHNRMEQEMQGHGSTWFKIWKATFPTNASRAVFNHILRCFAIQPSKSGAATSFLQRGFLCRFALLFPAAHNWLKLRQMSLQAKGVFIKVVWKIQCFLVFLIKVGPSSFVLTGRFGTPKVFWFRTRFASRWLPWRWMAKMHVNDIHLQVTNNTCLIFRIGCCGMPVRPQSFQDIVP